MTIIVTSLPNHLTLISFLSGSELLWVFHVSSSNNIFPPGQLSGHHSEENSILELVCSKLYPVSDDKTKRMRKLDTSY
jgi:hypothetical protein